MASGDSKDSDDCRYTVAYTNSPSGICDPFGIDDSDNDPTEAKHLGLCVFKFLQPSEVDTDSTLFGDPMKVPCISQVYQIVSGVMKINRSQHENSF